MAIDNSKNSPHISTEDLQKLKSKKLKKSLRSAINKATWFTDKTTIHSHGYDVSLQKALTCSNDKLRDKVLVELGRSEDAVIQVDTRDRITKYREHKADILAHKQLMMLDHINNDTLAKSDVKQLSGLFRELNQAERLERGQATNNIEIIAHMSETLARKKIGSTHGEGTPGDTVGG